MAVGVIIGLFFPQAVSKLSPIYTYFNLILKSILLVMLPLAIISNVMSSLIKGISAKFIGAIPPHPYFFLLVFTFLVH